MATSAASAAGSDSNRAAYARDLDSIGDSNRLRIDESTLSAFDLLLDLPIFENQLPPANVHSEIDANTRPEEDDASRLEDEDASRDDQDLSSNLVSLPISPRIQDTLNQEPQRLTIENRKIDVEQAGEVETPHDKESERKPAFEVNHDSNSIRSTDSENKERVDPLQNEVQFERTSESSNQVVERSPLPAPSANRDATQLADPNHQDSLAVNDSPRDRNEKTSKDRAPNDASHADAPSQTLANQPIKDSKQSKKLNKRDFEAESSKRATNAGPVFNRRAERLGENKRGGTLNNESKGDERELPDTLSSQGNIEVPSELTLTSELIDPASTLDVFQALSSSELSSSGATVSEAPSAQLSIESSVVSSGIAAAASATTPNTVSAAGLESNPSNTINSVAGAQGTTSLSASSASRANTPFAGRASTLSSYQEHRVLQRVLKGLEQLDSGGGSVRLRLHPPELGSLQITLRVEAQQVSALVEVEHTAARDILLSNLPQLQSRLSEQGMNVSQFDVQVVDPNQWSQGSDLGWEAGNGQGANQNDSESQRSSRYLERLRNQLDRPPTVESNSSGQAVWTRKNGQLDVRV